MKKQLLLLVLTLLPMLASADPVEIDGIYYNFSGSTATVTYLYGTDNNRSAYSGNVIIPKFVTYNGTTYSVTSIGERAFYECADLISVTIPSSVTNIARYAFRDCSSLTSITIPNSVVSIGADAFYGCSGLTSISIPNSVVSIGGCAFWGCSGLTSVTIPNSVTNIEESIFAYCPSLISIVVENGNTVYDSRENCNAIIETASNTLIAGCKNTIIPNSLTSIGFWAFWGCSGLTSITIPNSLTSIGIWAFMNCTGLTSITIPNSVTSIGGDAFNGCSGLTSIVVENGNTVYDSRENCNAIIETASNTLIAGCKNTIIPNSVTSIGEGAFYDCSGLTSVTIPNSVTSIGKSAFYNCSSLTSINIPNSVTSIGESAFFNCSSLTSINIPSSVTSIGDYAFVDCFGLTSVTIPNSVTSIGDGAFLRCSSLTSVTVENSTPILIGSHTFSNRANGTLYVPAGCKAAYMAAPYWQEFKEILEMSAPSPSISFADAKVKALCVANWDTNGDGELSEAEAAAVTSLGEVFKGNKEITSFDELQYFTGLTSIGFQAFDGCSGLTSITIPNSVTSIGYAAFMDCSGLTSITIPNSVTSIGDYAFDGCSGLTSITIPNSVTSIRAYAFYGCTGLTSIAIPNSVTSIGLSPFGACPSLTSIVVENGNTVYDSRDNCNAIIITASNRLIAGCKNTIIPNSVTDIYDVAFRECSSLTSITIPNSVFNIGYGAFMGCSSLTSITIPNSVAGICNHAFCGCSGLTSITIPNSVVGICNHAFCGCSGLTSITIPNSVVSIGDYAFDGCSSLTSITIPNSVMSIGDGAFIGCSALTSVTVENSTPISIKSNTFSNRANATLYVPAGCKAAYMAAPYWQEFKEIKEMSAPSPSISFADAKVKALCVANWDTNGDGELSEAEAAAVTSLGEVFKGNKEITSFDELQYFTGLTSIGFQAFDGCSGLTSITIPNSVTSIGDNAFWDCSGLTSITIPNSVTSIGYVAFQGCSGLTSITIPNSVTSIGMSAFQGCSGLTSITIPNSVTSIGYVAFVYCDGLSSINVESGNTKYDSRNNCNAIIETASNTLIAGCKNTIIPNSVTSIGDYAFVDCSGLTSITIPNSLTRIGVAVFRSCSALTSITIPNSVISIGSSAFEGCSALMSVTVENSTPISIESNTFSNRTNATLYVPAGCKAAYMAAPYWQEFKEIKEMSVPSPSISFADAKVNALCIANWDTNGDGELSEAEAAAVTSLGEVFKGNKEITSFDELQYFTGLTSIGDDAFYECADLISVTIPSSVTNIARNAFWDCYSLTSITIPNSVTSIGKSAFYYCTGLTSITIPNSVTSIGEGAFFGCSGLTSITIPNSVTSIGYVAFVFCDGLSSINVESGNTKYDSRNNCNAIIETASNTLIAGCKNTIIPNSVTSIGEGAFFGCSGLTSITIPNSVTSIGIEAFAVCSGLTSITIPNGVTSIGDYAFAGCSGLTSIIVADGNMVYDSRENCNAIIDTASNTLLAGCKNTNIPNSVTSIGAYAFVECFDLTSVTIPNSVTSIGDYAFDDCPGLTSVTVENSTPISIGSNTFSNRTNATLNVPAGSRAAYMAAPYWQEFKEIKEMSAPSPSISFADAKVKALCVANWDTNGDGELSEAEAAAVTSLGEVFKGNKEITSFDELQYFTGLTSIGDDAFYECADLISVTIPSSVTNIARNAFWDCSSLTSITIPSSVTNIARNAFHGCSGLTSITIPNSVTSIDYVVFVNCDGLSSINVESGNTKYDSRNNCNAIIETASNTLLAGCKNTIIPNSVTSIGDYAFVGCFGLTSITIPNSVTSIADGAFKNCSSLTSITIPNNVISIGYDVFRGCSALTSVTVENSTPISIGSNTFSNRANATLYVPAGCKAAYLAAPYWQEFKEILEMSAPSPSISFADAKVKALCIANWDTNGDGELSEAEAAAVTSLGEVFKGNEKITSFDELQYFTGLTSIGFQAFDGCSGLTSITIPNSVTSIGDNAFWGCSGLTSITIPNSVTSIGIEAFDGCSGLTSITIPNGVTSIRTAAFAGCSGLTSIIVADGNMVYDSRENCNAIIDTASNTLIAGCKNTVIPNGVTSIGDGAFDGCTGLTSITIPYSVTSIGDDAFFACSSLTSVTVENSTPISIGSNTFSNRANATLYVPAGCKAAYLAAPYWQEFKEILEMSDPSPSISFADAKVKALCVANWDSNGDGELSEAEAAAVTSLGEVFNGNEEITSFNELQYFTGLTCIDGETFMGCTALTSVTLPSNITYIEWYAFKDCSSLTSITIPENVLYLGYDVFAGCGSLESILVNTDNENLSSESGVLFNKNKTEILRYPMGKKDAHYDIPNSVTSIGGEAFANCSGLTSITIPNSVTTIANAFWGCSSLSSVTIPNSVTNINSNAFGACPNLTSIVVENGNPVYDSRDNCNAIIETASNTLIQGCKSSTIPIGVTSIGDYAFAACPLTSIIIPASVTHIGERAFVWCGSLTNIYCNAVDVPTTGEEVFGDYTYEDATLYVPAGCKTAYSEDASWGAFNRIVELIDIEFADAKVKALCVANWDTNGNGELSEVEAAAVTDLGIVFKGNMEITSFDELQYFTNLTTIGSEAFAGCAGLTSIIIPNSVTSIGNNVFTGCDGLISIRFPNSLQENNVGISLFSVCRNLAAIIWEPSFAMSEIMLGGVQNPNLLFYTTSASYAPPMVKNVVVNGWADEITLVDAESNNNFYCPEEFTARSIKYTHNYRMTSGIDGRTQGWETLALPFDVTEIRHSTKGEMTPFASWDASSSAKPFWLYSLSSDGFVKANSINANTPYIISMPNNAKYISDYILSGSVTFSATNATVKVSSSVNIGKEGNKSFIPVFCAKEKGDGIFALNVINDLYAQTGGYDEGSLFINNLRALSPFEAYMTNGSPSTRQMMMIKFNNPNLIVDMEKIICTDQTSGEDDLYTLSGMKIDKEQLENGTLPNGVYIKNGQKIVINK